MTGMTKCNGRNQWTLAGRVLLLASVALLVGTFCQFALGAAPATPKAKDAEPDTKPRPKAEQAKDEEDAALSRFRAREEDPMGEDRMKRIESLVAIVRSEELVTKDRTKLFNAVLRLGRMKAVEGAGAIAERLDLYIRTKGRVHRPLGVPSYDDEYPALPVLAEIGEGALPYIADALFARKRSAKFKSNALIAIHRIMGGDLEKAKKYLRGRLAMHNAATKDLPKMLGNWGAVINMKDYSSPAPPEEP